MLLGGKHFNVIIWPMKTASITFFARLMLIAIGAVFVSASFVYPSRHLQHNIPALVGLCALAFGVFWPRVVMTTSKGWKKAVRIAALCLIAFYVVTFAIMCFAIYINARRVPESGHDAVIILGAGLVRHNQIPVVLRQRLDVALAYLLDNPNTVAVVTGGLGAQATITEAYAMGSYLIQQGIAPERIIFEEWSTTTQENLGYARKLLDSFFDGQEYTVVVATNDFHVPRARILAWQAGLTAVGKAAPTQRHTIPRYYSREHAALLWHIILWPLVSQ